MTLHAATSTAFTPPARLLLVAPDRPERRGLQRCLRDGGHAVLASADPRAVDDAPRRGIHLLLLDPRIEPARPGRTDAWWRLRRLREQHRQLPVLVLQPDGGPTDRSVAFEMGADAVLDPRSDPRELRAQVAALLRRATAAASTQREAVAAEAVLHFGAWSLDPDERCLHTATGLRVPLSPAEYRLLRVFLEHPRRTLPRQLLMDMARGVGTDQLDRSIDLLVSRLRHKLAEDAQQPDVIRTVRGVGYLFEALGGDAGAPVSATSPS